MQQQCKTVRFFNTAGPCNPVDHYMLPALARLEELQVERLIAQKAYFVLHAPRQTGKTTAMMALADQLTSTGQYIGVVFTMVDGVPFPQHVGKAEDAILDAWQERIIDQLTKDFHPPGRDPGVPEVGRCRILFSCGLVDRTGLEPVTKEL